MKISENDKRLLEAARKAQQNSYSPYSEFRVGAAIQSGSGKIYSGCNVENASYGLTTCAERTAIFKMISEGDTGIVSVAVVVDGKRVVTPCGACRQVISEFADPECRIICSCDDKTELFELAYLLPTSFKSSDLT